MKTGRQKASQRGMPPDVKLFISRALAEDIGNGDITTEALISPASRSRAVAVAKDDLVVAGIYFFMEVFGQIDSRVNVSIKTADGQRVRKGAVICEVVGATRSILQGERVSLNILRHLSGIATLTARYVDAAKGLQVRIMDTRKTTPCMRYMEKMAVKAGGGHNHRFGLFDGLLIKDNHIKAAGGIARAVEKARACHHLLRVEVEVTDLVEFRQAVKAGADVIMLDNMPIAMMKKAVLAVAGVPGRPFLEASGNITLDRVRAVALTGVDLVSVGAITHSAPAADISLKIV